MPHEFHSSTTPLPNITVTQLEYLTAVMASDTWAMAAERLNVSPSALSQGLAELERRVGVTLFDRDGRRRVLRPEAGFVVDHAARVLEQTRAVIERADALNAGKAGALRVGMIDSAAVDHYPTVLAEFRANAPHVDLHLIVEPSSRLLSQLRAGTIDLAVCVRPDDATGLEVIDILQEPLGIYPPPSLRPGPPSSWGPWVTFPAGSQTRRLIETTVAGLGATFAVVAESHQPEVLVEMVMLGLGWTVLPVAQAERGPRALRRADSPIEPRRTLVVARRANDRPAAAADQLREMLTSTGNQTASQIVTPS